jgi:hypothetical protein
MALVVAFVLALIGSGPGIGGAIRLVVVVVVGLGAYLTGAGLAAGLQAWQNARRIRSQLKRRVVAPYQSRHR